MDFYRSNFPSESVTPKLHLLERHIIPFLAKWGWGLGKYSEQGGEGIHAEFNSLNRTYCCMKPDEKRLLAIMREHHIRVNPAVRNLRPEKKKRKIENEE